MGRHSAPDDEGDLLVAAPEAPTRPSPRGRHATPDEVEALESAVVEPEVVERRPERVPHDVVDAVVVEDERPVPTRTSALESLAVDLTKPTALADEPKPEKAERGSRADLRLLRSDRALRARCIAAILVPFALYTLVLVVIAALGAYLIWIWIPAILAGVLFGAQLDGAHKRAAGRAAAAASAGG